MAKLFKLGLQNYFQPKILVAALFLLVLGYFGIDFINNNNVAHAETNLVSAEQINSGAEAMTKALAVKPAPKPTQKPVQTAVAAPKTAVTTPKPAPVQAAACNFCITIPGILSSPIQTVGLTAAGAIAVPGNAVGYWNGSAYPGNSGATFLDGHSGGVFRNLHLVSVGTNIILTVNGADLTYQVVDKQVFDYNYQNPGADSNLQMMRAALSARGSRGLNLMTCAGVPVAGTYSQRLVVFAVQV